MSAELIDHSRRRERERERRAHDMPGQFISRLFANYILIHEAYTLRRSILGRPISFDLMEESRT